MSYQVLARKWRPKDFDQLVGQEHVVRALVNALEQDRLHHAYLFSGTRGVGKTTIARILAKCLNCDKGLGARPCGECAACVEIDEGRFVDLIEVDAASRTKVDDTRELLENVQYAPVRGRYKVYLVDEVHMLSGHSFNALLKTLEEPPPHVKFLLATTDPQKLPVTVLSRCLQFHLKRLDVDAIAAQMRSILGVEQVEAEEAALARLARAADGSMRDGLSLLDQAIAFGGGGVVDAEVQTMLGSIERSRVADLLSALADGNADDVLTQVGALRERGSDYGRVLNDLCELLHRVAVAQVTGELVDASGADAERVGELAAGLSPEDVQLFYQIGVHGRRDMNLAPEPRVGLEMTLLRMLAFRPVTASTPAAPPAGKNKAAIAGGSAPPAAPDRMTSSKPARSKAQTQESATEVPRPAGVADSNTLNWTQTVEALGLRGSAKELADNCCLTERSGHRLVLSIDRRVANLRTRTAEERLARALGKYYGEAVDLRFEELDRAPESPAAIRNRAASEQQQAVEASIMNDPTVNALERELGAQIVPNSVRPADSAEGNAGRNAEND